MTTTRISSKGQVVIPKPIRRSHHWEVGEELVVVEMGEGVLLKPKPVFRITTMSQVGGCLSYKGEAKSVEDMEQAIGKGVKESFT
ncbi:MAG: AbrB/MazE/SpoVT family DNA-binding domain-containing protein [Planctomycetes bacterium]|nr:AbrB/MazE/SpoVT family DNA-binding domain-containing protein [Planctomycetota bacterium]